MYAITDEQCRSARAGRPHGPHTWYGNIHAGDPADYRECKGRQPTLEWQVSRFMERHEGRTFAEAVAMDHREALIENLNRSRAAGAFFGISDEAWDAMMAICREKL